MSWIEKLYETYECNSKPVGVPTDEIPLLPVAHTTEIPLLPVAHTTQKAQVTIVIDGNGNFLRASIVPKSEARTVIPATEVSAGRTRGVTPHPLCDKLQYVAGDYERFGGEKEHGYESYKKLLSDWRAHSAENEKINAVFNYIGKGSVIKDLVNERVLHVDVDSGKLLNKWPAGDNLPEIFKLLAGGVDNKGENKPWQADAFIRWKVDIPGNPQTDVWTDEGLLRSWIEYYGNLQSKRGVCFVTGEDTFLAEQHPAKLRNDGDKAKLISSNDTSGFTFRGRFISASDACGVGFEVTQKAHNALRWLIARQGRSDSNQTVVAWAVTGAEIPDPFADTFSLFNGKQLPMNGGISADTAQEIGNKLSKLIAGYSANLGPTDDVVVMALDSATPGRMAITFYRELTGSELLKRVESWHTKCAWPQKYSKEKTFVGTPAPRDIAEAAYGRSLDDKLRKATIERLLPCIIDAVTLPRDLVESCVRRASNRNGIESWEWEKTLGIACALYRYQHNERNYDMALETDRKTRDYLYGRLLAIADNMESYAIKTAGENRETNASRLMQRFADRPHTTWLIIETSLAPYKARLKAKKPGFLFSREKEMDEVMCSFASDEFVSDRRLTGEFLLGYHCQRSKLLEKQAAKSVEDDTDSEDQE